MEHSLQDFRIGFFIDGFTLKKVNEYYRYYHPFQSCLDFVGLKNWAKAEALKVFRWIGGGCLGNRTTIILNRTP